MIAALLPLLGSGFAIAGDDRERQAEPDLSGTWMLDAEASDDLAEVMANRRSVTRRGAGMARRRAAGGAGGQRVMRREDVYDDIESLAKAPERLAIEQAEGEVTLSSPDGLNVVLQTTGERQNRTWFDGVGVEVTADWSDDALRVERTLEHATAVDTYSRDALATRLVVTTIISGGMAGDVTLRRYYDLDPES